MLILFSLPHDGEEVLSKLVLPAIINRIAMARNGLKSISALLTFGFFALVASAGFFIFSPSTTTLCPSVVEVLVATDFFTGAYTSVDVVELLTVPDACFFGFAGAASSFTRSELVVLNPLLSCGFFCSVVDVVGIDVFVVLGDPGAVEVVLPAVSVFTTATAGTVKATISATAKCNDIKSLFNINLVSTHDYQANKSA
ncbi:MAG: hypothetical protein ACYC56_02965 [Candidatus Aquicultor sp.]